MSCDLVFSLLEVWEYKKVKTGFTDSDLKKFRSKAEMQKKRVQTEVYKTWNMLKNVSNVELNSKNWHSVLKSATSFGF